MNIMAWPHGKSKFAANLLPTVWNGFRYVVELFGGPDRDRTDDLFHAMEARSQLRHRPTIGGIQLFYFRRSDEIRQTLLRTSNRPLKREQANLCDI